MNKDKRQLITTLFHALAPLLVLIVGLHLTAGLTNLPTEQDIGLGLCGIANAWGAFYLGWFIRKTWVK